MATTKGQAILLRVPGGTTWILMGRNGKWSVGGSTGKSTKKTAADLVARGYSVQYRTATESGIATAYAAALTQKGLRLVPGSGASVGMKGTK